MLQSDSLCTVRVGPARIGVSTSEVREVLDRSRPQAVPLASAFVAGVIPYRGEILPVLSLHVLLGIAQSDSPAGMLVFASPDANEFYGVAVDTVEGITEVRFDSWQENPSTFHPLSSRLFRGSFRDPFGLILRLAPFELAPSRLMQTEWLAESSYLTTPETECTR